MHNILSCTICNITKYIEYPEASDIDFHFPKSRLIKPLNHYGQAMPHGVKVLIGLDNGYFLSRMKPIPNCNVHGQTSANFESKYETCLVRNFTWIITCKKATILWRSACVNHVLYIPISLPFKARQVMQVIGSIPGDRFKTPRDIFTQDLGNSRSRVIWVKNSPITLKFCGLRRLWKVKAIR